MLFRLVGDPRATPAQPTASVPVGEVAAHEASEPRSPVPIHGAPVKQDSVPSLVVPTPPRLRHIHKPFFQVYYRPFTSYWTSSHGAPSIVSGTLSANPSFHEFPEQMTLARTNSFQSVRHGVVVAPVAQPLPLAPQPVGNVLATGQVFPDIQSMYPVFPQNFHMAGNHSTAAVQGVSAAQPVAASLEVYAQQPAPTVSVHRVGPIPHGLIRHGLRLGTWANPAAHDRYNTEHVSGAHFGDASAMETGQGKTQGRQPPSNGAAQQDAAPRAAELGHTNSGDEHHHDDEDVSAELAMHMRI